MVSIMPVHAMVWCSPGFFSKLANEHMNTENSQRQRLSMIKCFSDEETRGTRKNEFYLSQGSLGAVGGYRRGYWGRTGVLGETRSE